MSLFVIVTDFIAALLVMFVIYPVPYASAQNNSTEAMAQEAKRQTISIQQGGKNWPAMETEFFIIHHQPGVQPNPMAIIALDLFVAKTLALFETPDAFITNLRNNRLHYYLCHDTMVTQLTGYQTKGMADLAGRAVISSHFPHFHELAHLLVHLVQENPPIQTHPLVQEGIACLLGGRWGRSPEIILYTGWVHQNMGMGELDAVLTQADFFSFPGGADASYPMGAMLCEMVRRQAGWPGVLALNKELSGSAEKVAAFTSEDVVAAIADICQWDRTDGGTLMEEFMANLWPEYRRCGIAPVATVLSRPPARKILSGKGVFFVEQDGNHHQVSVSTGKYPVYLVSPAESFPWGFSSLFTEHFPDMQYHGQRFGLRCSADSISLYDFSTNQLIALWVAGFTDEIDACSDPENGLIFELSHHFQNYRTTTNFPGTSAKDPLSDWTTYR